MIRHICTLCGYEYDVEKAKQLLMTTNISVEEISRMLNFSSASYFRKILKKYSGKTPKEIRKTLRIREGDPLEIFTDREGEIILKKWLGVL